MLHAMSESVESDSSKSLSNRLGDKCAGLEEVEVGRSSLSTCSPTVVVALSRSHSGREEPGKCPTSV